MKNTKKVTIGRDVLSPKKVSEMLTEANKAYDGPAGVALQFTPGGDIRLIVVEDEDQTVVHLPGDGARFPLRAFTEALLVAQVLEG